jgi:hypothetical protein
MFSNLCQEDFEKNFNEECEGDEFSIINIVSSIYMVLSLLKGCSCGNKFYFFDYDSKRSKLNFTFFCSLGCKKLFQLNKRIIKLISVCSLVCGLQSTKTTDFLNLLGFIFIKKIF